MKKFIFFLLLFQSIGGLLQAQEVVELTLPFASNSVDVLPIAHNDSLFLYVDRKAGPFAQGNYFWVGAKGKSTEIKFQNFNIPIAGIIERADSIYYYFVDIMKKDKAALGVMIANKKHTSIKRQDLKKINRRVVGYSADSIRFLVYTLSDRGDKINITRVEPGKGVDTVEVILPVSILDKKTAIQFYSTKAPAIPIFSGASTKIFQEGEYLWIVSEESFPLFDPSRTPVTTVIKFEIFNPTSIAHKVFVYPLPDISSANATLSNGKLIRAFTMGSKIAFEVFDFTSGSKVFSKLVEYEDEFTLTYKYTRSHPTMHPSRSSTTRPFSRLRTDFISADCENQDTYYLAFGASRTKWNFIPNYVQLLAGIAGAYNPNLLADEQIFRYCFMRAHRDGRFDFEVSKFLPKKVDDLEAGMFNNESSIILTYLQTNHSIFGFYKPPKRPVIRIIKYTK